MLHRLTYMRISQCISRANPVTLPAVLSRTYYDERETFSHSSRGRRHQGAPRYNNSDREINYERNDQRGGYGGGSRGGYGGGSRFGARGGGGGGSGFRASEEPFVREDVSEDVLFENMINSGINFDKYDDIPVEIQGEDIPEPIQSFREADLHQWLMRNLDKAKYGKPTPVQKHGLPIVMSGKDMMACAQTGSGKTAGFLFPMIDMLLKGAITEQRKNQPQKEPSPVKAEFLMEDMKYGYSEGSDFTAKPLALILAPTRELCLQLYDEARKFTYHTPVRTVALFGGSSMAGQVSQLQRGCHIVVATPGRLADMMERGIVTMKDIQFLVLDEADRMLDMGFEPQIRRIVEEEAMPSPGVRQTLMYSATFPEEIQSLAKSFLGNYAFLTVGRVGAASENITQQILQVENMQKRTQLIQLLDDMKESNGLSLVFVSRKSTANYLEKVLIDSGLKAEAIHGDKSQRQRDSALRAFKNGYTKVLVATEVAARGLDIGNVQHVINFDLPENIDSYIHRIGRTGRAGNTGLATSFFTMDTNPAMAKDLIKALEETNMDVPAFVRTVAAQTRNGRSNKRTDGNSHSFSVRGGGGSRSGYDRGSQSRYGGRGAQSRRQPANDDSQFDDDFF